MVGYYVSWVATVCCEVCAAHARCRGGRLPSACSGQYSPAKPHLSSEVRRERASCSARKSAANISMRERESAATEPLSPLESLRWTLLARCTGEVAQGGRRAPVRPGHPASQYTTHHTHKRTCSQVYTSLNDKSLNISLNSVLFSILWSELSYVRVLRIQVSIGTDDSPVKCDQLASVWQISAHHNR